MTRISVIMGIYNTNNIEMVKKSINSILNQTFNDFEFIICDDGSVDETYEIVEKLTNHDKRVKLIKNKFNVGLAATLNNCLKISTGEFIARMDADDISMLSRFEKQISFLESHLEYDFVGSNIALFEENEIWGYKNMTEQPVNRSFLFQTPFIHPTVLMRKEALTKIGGYRVAKETLRCEDYDLFMRFYAQGMKGYNIQEALLQYREDKSAYDRRKYKYRIDEAKVRYKGFKVLNLMPLGLVFCIKPLIVGLIPQKILAVLRNEKQ